MNGWFGCEGRMSRCCGGSIFQAAVVILCFAGYFGIGWFTADRISPTQDEPLHLVSGTAYWQFHDYRLQPENGLASQRWIGLGVLLAGDGEGPDTGGRLWRSESQWFNAYQFLEDSGRTALLGGRLAVLVAGGILLLLVWRCSHRLWGPWGGVVSLAVGCFSPTLLAHATLATSDAFLALTYFCATIALIALLRRPTPSRTAVAGLLCGLAALSKYSAVVLGPVVAGILVLLLVLRRPARPVRFVSVRVFCLLAAGVVAYGVIWSGYGFRYQAFHPDLAEGRFHQSWEELRTDSFPSRTIAFLEDHRIFPEAYLYGAEQTYFYSRSRAAFFLGETGSGGYRLYFPLAFLLKTSPILLVAMVLLPAFVYRWRSRGRKVARRGGGPEIVGGTVIAAGGFLLFCVFSNLNIGNRHMLPVFPFLFLWAGAFVPLLEGWRFRIPALSAALMLHAGLAVWVAPAFLSYFNPLAGGSGKGYFFFADSSYDWGQEMYVLAEWLEENPDPEGREVQLVLFAPMKPSWYGIDGRVLYQFGAGFPAGWVFPEIRPGRVAATATMVSGPYYLARGMAWDETEERNYRLTRSLIAEGKAVAGEDPGAWIRHMNAHPDRPWERIFQVYSRLRIKRLVSLLRQEESVTRPADTIFVWDLSQALYDAADFGGEPLFAPDSPIPSIIQQWSARRRAQEADEQGGNTGQMDPEPGGPGQPGPVAE